jgi:Cu(I)/Ag(I) efflux system membrane protein CusA/SilA
VVAEQVNLPPGYTLGWSGQYEYMGRAAKRLRIMIPLTLGLIFLLLYFNFRNLLAPLVVMLSIPFGVIGGVWTVYLLGYNLSVAVAVGFIALAGVSAEIGVLVLTFIDHELERPGDAGSATDRIREAVRRGTSERLRPIVMTSVATMGGLMPIMWSSGTGSDVMHRIAAPMAGGMVTVLLLNLLVLPVVYGLALKVRHRLGGAETQGTKIGPPFAARRVAPGPLRIPGKMAKTVDTGGAEGIVRPLISGLPSRGGRLCEITF